MEATRTMEPGLPAAIMDLPTAWETRKDPVRLISMSRRNMVWSYFSAGMFEL